MIRPREHVGEFDEHAAIGGSFAGPDADSSIVGDESEAGVVALIVRSGQQRNNSLTGRELRIGGLGANAERPVVSGRRIVDRDCAVVGGDAEMRGGGCG